MSRREDLWLSLTDPLGRLPVDLAGATVVTLLVNGSVFLPVVRETPARIVLGLAFVLFVPGYVFVTALFPEAGTPPTDRDEEGEPSTGNDRGIDGIERVALSFGLSIALVPLIGLVLNFTPWGIRLVPIMVALSGFTLVVTGIAAYRRAQLPADERFRVPVRSWYVAGRDELLHPASRTDAALNGLLLVSVLLATASVGYAVAVPQQGERFSEFYLLTENETGALVADEYPTEFEANESRELVVGIGNHEHETVQYTVVVELQRVEFVDNETRILERDELRRFTTTVDHNETWHRSHGVSPTMTGDRLRLQYLLYRESPSATPNVSAAYRELHLWVNVTDADAPR